MAIGENSRVSRRALLGAFAGIAATAAAPSYAGVFSFNKGAGDIRRIAMYSGRTGESINTIYWIEGEYIKEALDEINYFMRDWRHNEVIRYDPRNIDIMAASHRLMEANEPYLLLSGYRNPATNAMLRRRNRGVAKNSYHIKGMAADLRLKSRGIRQMAAAAKACHSGGVGTYYRSNFVHMDCGPVRTWRR
ncbi:MAG: YcbK family protein [Paracoccaceae bacterium]